MTNIIGPRSNGQLQLIIGPMFSGKTSELLRRIRRHQLCGHKCLLVRFSDEKLVTHSGLAMSAMMTEELNSLGDEDFDVIGIDEGQFFPDLDVFCQKHVGRGRTVIIAGLDATDLREGFDNMLQLVPLAHSVDKLSAVCMSCGDKASFSKKILPESTIVGGCKYMAVCRQCYKVPLPEKSSPFKRMEIPEHPHTAAKLRRRLLKIDSC